MRDINDLLDTLRTDGDSVDCHAATRGDVRLAAATLAAYTRSLPEPLLPAFCIESLFLALDVEDYAHRVAAMRDSIAELPEANQAVLHRLCHFLRRVGANGRCGLGTASGAQLADLTQFWCSMLTPQASNKPRALRVKEYRVVGLMLQQSQCIFGGSLETHELPELPLPARLYAEQIQDEAALKRWVKIKASLLRDSKSQFKISLLEDCGGIHINKIEHSDVHDDRQRLQPHDYLVSINHKLADEMSLKAAKDVIKNAGSIIEVEVRRHEAAEAPEVQYRQEEKQQRSNGHTYPQSTQPNSRHVVPCDRHVGQRASPDAGRRGRTACRMDALSASSSPAAGGAIPALLGHGFLSGDSTPSEPPPASSGIRVSFDQVGAGNAHNSLFRSHPPAVSAGRAPLRTQVLPNPFASSCSSLSQNKGFSLAREGEEDALLTASSVWYTDTNGDRVVARILKVHCHADSPPHYTILVNGEERETLRTRLEPMPSDPSPAVTSSSCVQPRLQIHLTADVKTLSRSSAMRAYCMRLTQELGTVLHSPPSRFEVLETKTLPGTGTLIVDFSIAPPLTPSAPSSDTLRRKLVHQIASGALFHHPILHSINPQYGVTEVQPPTSMELSPPRRSASPGLQWPSVDPSCANPQSSSTCAVGTDSAYCGGFGPSSSNSNTPPPCSGGWVAFIGNAPAGAPVASLPMNDNLLGGDTGGGKTFGGGVGGDSDDGSWLGVLSPSTQSEEPKVDALPERLATYRGLSIDEKRRKIREKLEAQRNEKRQVAEKEKMLVEKEKVTKAAVAEEAKATMTVEKKLREEEYRAAIRARLAAEKMHQQQEKWREAEGREQKKREEEVEAMAHAGLYDRGVLSVLEETLALAEQHSIRMPLICQARARLKALQESELMGEAEHARATAALNAACHLTDHYLLRETLATAAKAGVNCKLVTYGEKRFVGLREAATRRAEEEDLARKQAGQIAKMITAAMGRMRLAADTAEDEDRLDLAIDGAADAGVDQVQVWTATNALMNFRAERIKRQEVLQVAQLALEEAIEIGEIDEVEHAIGAAEDVGVGVDTVDHAKAHLERLKGKEKARLGDEARAALRRAADGEKEDAIQRAIEGMAEVGLGDEPEVGVAKARRKELRASREAAEAERRAAAGELKQLLASKLTETAVLQAAFARAVSVGLDMEELSRAQQRLFEIEETAAMRSEEEGDLKRAEVEEERRAREEDEVTEEEWKRRKAEAIECVKAVEAERPRMETEEEAVRERIDEKEGRRVEKKKKMLEQACIEAEEAEQERIEDQRLEAEPATAARPSRAVPPHRRSSKQSLEVNRSDCFAVAVEIDDMRRAAGVGKKRAQGVTEEEAKHCDLYPPNVPAWASPQQRGFKDADDGGEDDEEVVEGAAADDAARPTEHDEALVLGSNEQTGALLRALLVRDSEGRFKVMIGEDGGGLYLKNVGVIDNVDDRSLLAPHMRMCVYLYAIEGIHTDELNLHDVRELIKNAGQSLELCFQCNGDPWRRASGPDEPTPRPQETKVHARGAVAVPPRQPLAIADANPAAMAAFTTSGATSNEPTAGFDGNLSFAASYRACASRSFHRTTTLHEGRFVSPPSGIADEAAMAFDEMRQLCLGSHAAQRELSAYCRLFMAEVDRLELLVQSATQVHVHVESL